jgi:hypothetical protein
MGERRERGGVIVSRQIGEAIVGLMTANEVYEATAAEIRRDPELLRRIAER